MDFNAPEPPVLPGIPVGYAPAVIARAANPLELPISRGAARWGLLVVVMAGILAPFVTEIGIEIYLQVSRLEYYRDNPLILLGRKVFDACWVLALALVLKRWHKLSLANFGFTSKQPLRQIALGILTALGVYAAFALSVIVVLIVMLFLPEKAVEDEARNKIDFMEALPFKSYWIGFLLMIPVAIHEEILFRGLLLPFLRRSGLWWGATIGVGALIFGSLHFMQGPTGMFQVGLVGLVLCIAFVRTRALMPVMIAHFIFDAAQFTLMSVLLPILQAARDKGGVG